ncbi:MAG: 16S rRNA (guanine(527)-N(7))-methyltransferase RsmG, partial [Planctomycetales bacterium]
EWNEKINLTRHTTLELFAVRDVVDGLELANLLQPGEKVLDVGTGGGTPGVIVSILRPDVRVSLLEQTEKKSRAVSDMMKRLDLSIPVIRARVQEHLESSSEGAYNSLLVRAVAPMPKLLRWLQGHWGKFDRLLAIKGRRWKEECDLAKQEKLTERLRIRRVAEYETPGTDAVSVVLEVAFNRR